MYAFVGAAALLAAVGATLPLWRGIALVATALTLGLYIDYAMLSLWAALSPALAIVCWNRGRLESIGAWLAGSVLAGLAAAPLWTHLHASLGAQIGASYLTENVRQVVELPALGSWTYVFLLAGLAAASTAATLAIGFLSRRLPYGAGVLSVAVLIAAAVL